MLWHPFHVNQIPVLYVSIDTAMAMGITDRTKSFQDRHLDTSVVVIYMSDGIDIYIITFKIETLPWQLFFESRHSFFLT